jgi:uncharacterized protein (TIGR02271 family)
MHDRDRNELIRSEEQLDVRAEPVLRPGVGVRKYAETEEVEAAYERAVEQVDDLERAPPAESDSGDVEVLPDGSVSIPVFEERLVVTKEVVVKERVIVRKRTVTETQLVRESLRRERVDVTGDNEEE